MISNYLSRYVENETLFLTDEMLGNRQLEPE